ncbi:ABC transporter substrate-binding protein [Paenibacillus montaniterrae]|uniref:ABC transporter substrate-binding protein n=1 Tax=Paenibacillus montaniterrae TaxID=429341 RepID=A0A919YPD8_9BACL|nr:ABC transporter substrate-binding protein [Paenibacillus montaniterrae]GIP17220.1 ABC transporter substrate-binding protein [Paenibacillus montaniterrae]
MRKTKQRATLLAAIILAIAMLVSACGGNNAPNNTGNQTNNTEQNTNTQNNGQTEEEGNTGESELEPYQLTLVYPGSPQKDEALVEEALNKLLTEKINATIDLMPIDWGSWDEKVNLMIASREEVDIIFTAQWNGHASNVGKGAFLELDNLIQQHGQGILETQDPTFLEGARINGKNYGIPTTKELAAAGGIIYRKDVAEELGIDMSQVKTIKDLDAVYAKVKAERPDLTPLYISSTDNTFNSHFFGNYDFLGDATIPGAIFKDGTDTTVVPIETTERFLETTRLTHEFFKKGYINADAATSQVSAPDAWKAGIVFSAIESLKPGKDEEVATTAGLSGKLGQIQLTNKTIATSETAGSMLGISSTSQDPERAMMFINLLHTDKEINNLINFGIKDVHFTLNGEIMSKTDRTGDYSPGANWMLGNQFLNYLWDTEDPQKWEKFKEFNTGATKSPALGFVFNSEPVKNEIGALANVIKQYQVAIDRGVVNIDDVLDEYMSAMKAAGLDKVIAEKQAQFDEFLASK